MEVVQTGSFHTDHGHIQSYCTEALVYLKEMNDIILCLLDRASSW